MSLITLGLDVSKGYVDVLSLDNEGVLGPLERLDDGPLGHQRLWAMLDECVQAYTAVAVGVESTGGLERNWKRCVLAWCKEHAIDRDQVRFDLLDPRIVKRTAESLGTRCKTDQSSARAIAESLHRQYDDRAILFDDPKVEACRSWFRAISGAEKREIEVINQIKALLPQIHPALVSRLSQSGLPHYALELLTQYPTAERLARARSQTVAKISGITDTVARQLITDAQQHKMAANGVAHEHHMRFLVHSLALMKQLTKEQWTKLASEISDSTEIQRLKTIPGIGDKVSLAMIAEMGTLTRFVSGDALVAYCGLDPIFEQSGDGIISKGISHRGPAKLRGILYSAARSAITHNPVIKAFFNRLRAKGKPYTLVVTACMAKLLRLMYACVITETNFDSAIHEHHLKQCNGDQRAHEPTGRQIVKEAVRDPLAPISRKEKQRRKAQEKQQVADAQRGQSLNAGSPAVADDSALGRRKIKNQEPANMT